MTDARLAPEDALRSASVRVRADLFELKGEPADVDPPVNSTANQLWEIGPQGLRVQLGVDDDGRWTILESSGEHPLLTPRWVGPATGTGPNELISFCEDILSGDPARRGRWTQRSPIPPEA